MTAEALAVRSNHGAFRCQEQSGQSAGRNEHPASSLIIIIIRAINQIEQVNKGCSTIITADKNNKKPNMCNSQQSFNCKEQTSCSAFQ
jgi:hypothetical protein